MQRTPFRNFTFRRNLLLLTMLFMLMGLASSCTLAAQDAQTLTGQWQGKTEGAMAVRVVLRIKAAGGDSPSGVLYLLTGSNDGWPHATTSFTRHGADVAFVIANLEVNYEGKLSEDGKSIAGTMRQRDKSAALKLERVSGDAAWEIPAAGKTMPATADPSFEVATIKPSDPDDHTGGFQLRGGRLHVQNESLEDIVSFAYRVHRKQILNAPSWFGSERWVIDGIADTPGAPDTNQMRSMYRKLLADRFGLKLEQEKRELPVYVLEPGKDGPKLTRSVSEGGLPDSTGTWGGSSKDVRFTNITMDEFADTMSMTEDRPVVNHTGLTGRYDFRLKWSSATTENTDPDAPPALFRAMQEQLGLRMEATRAPASAYVVTHVERPSGN